MKTITITVLILVLSIGSFASPGPVDKVFRKYKRIEGAQSFTVNSLLIWFAERFAEDEETELILESVDKVRILNLDQCYNPKGLMRDVEKSVKDENYELLASVRELNQKFKFYARKTKSVVEELVVVMEGDDENMLLIIKGNIDVKQFVKLIQSDKNKHSDKH